jgi:cell cycle sensor histidine kinase DivJ
VLVLAVEDTGVGISAEDLPQVGRPFFQARAAYDRRHDGTGLGLSIVQGLVMLHGGHVDIHSRLGEGTRVTIRLPLDCETVRPVRETSNIERPSFESTESSSGLESKIKKTA